MSMRSWVWKPYPSFRFCGSTVAQMTRRSTISTPVVLVVGKRRLLSVSKENGEEKYQPPLARIQIPLSKPSSSSSLILPSVVGLAEWREKVRLDSLERTLSHPISSLDHSTTGSQSTSSTTTTTTTTTTTLPLEVLQLPVEQLYRPDLHLPSAPVDWSGYEASTPLTRQLIALIGVTGRPISTADYMRLALTHPQHGYYTNAVSSSSSYAKNSLHATTERFRTTTTGNGQDDSLDEFDHDDYDTSTTTAAQTDTVIGADFVTAPEVSNIFGECLGFWFAAVWDDAQNSSTSRRDKGGGGSAVTTAWQWVECGPGKGSLMVDLLRLTLQLSTSAAPDESPLLLASNQSRTSGPLFGDGCRHVHFIEQSPVFRKQQREALLNANPKVQLQFDTLPESESESDNDQRVISVHWHDTWAAFEAWQGLNVPQQDWLPTFVVAQEFLDALPVYAFEKTNEGYWRERLVDVALRDDLDDESMDNQDQAQSPAHSNNRSNEEAETTASSESLPIGSISTEKAPIASSLGTRSHTASPYPLGHQPRWLSQ
jgi:SAM-dependent MidA family methyltransferase